MNNSNKNFKALVAKMDQLQETEQGKLKGGISTLGSSNLNSSLNSNYFQCTCTNNVPCKKPKTSTVSSK